jgi:hypothetical protein
MDVLAPAKRAEFSLNMAFPRKKVPPLLFSLEPLGIDIEFHGCAEAATGFASVLRGWGGTPVPRRDDVEPDIKIIRSGGVHHWHGTGLTKPLVWRERAPSTIMGVICDLHDVLFDWFLDRHTEHLCLHAAAIEVGQGLILIPSVGRAGKSTLSVAMAELGHRVFADDVLALEPERDHGTAFGILPRLRLPLPEKIGSRYRRFLGNRTGPANDHWVYAALRDGEIAPFGTTAPIKAIVFLDRRTSGAARLEPVASAYVLRELVQQNFAEGVAPVPAFDRLLALAARADCRRLVFSDTNEAAELLSSEYRAKRQVRTARSMPAKLGVSGVERRFGEALFLVSQRRNAVLGLSPTAAAIWRQVTEGRSRRVVEALFNSAFPNVDPGQIKTDIDQAYRMFERHGLVRANGRIAVQPPGRGAANLRAPRRSSARR